MCPDPQSMTADFQGPFSLVDQRNRATKILGAHQSQQIRILNESEAGTPFQKS